MGSADYANAEQNLRVRTAGTGVTVDILGRECVVGPSGIHGADGGSLPVEVRIVLAWYVLHGAKGELMGRWTLYRKRLANPPGVTI